MNISEEYLIQRRARLGQLIKEKREAKGLSQAELGDLIGGGKRTVDNIETGKWNYDIKFLLLVEHALGAEIVFD